MTVASASANAAYSIRSGRRLLPLSACAMRCAATPERRTMPMPPRPGAVAIAAIVSAPALTAAVCAAAAARLLRGTALDAARDQPLLGQAQYTVHRPVQDQACGEERKHDGEHQGHHLH